MLVRCVPNFFSKERQSHMDCKPTPSAVEKSKSFDGFLVGIILDSGLFKELGGAAINSFCIN